MLDILLLAGLGVIVCRILFAAFSSLESLFSTQKTLNPTEPIKLNPEPMKIKTNIKEQSEFRQARSLSFPTDKLETASKKLRPPQPCETSLFQQEFQEDSWVQQKKRLIKNYQTEMSHLKKQIESMKEQKVYYIKKIEDIIENVAQQQEKQGLITSSQELQTEEVLENNQANLRRIEELEENLSILQGKLICSETSRQHEKEDFITRLKQAEEMSNTLRQQLERLSQITPVHPSQHFTLQKCQNFVFQGQRPQQNQPTECRNEPMESRDELTECKSELTECKSELMKCRDELNNGRSELTNGRSELTKSRKELTKCKNELDECKSELHESKSELTKSRKEIIECKRELSECMSELQNVTRRYYILQSQHEGANKTIKQQKKLIQKTEEKLILQSNCSSKQIDEQKKILQRMQLNEEKMKFQIEELKMRLQKKQKQPMTGQKIIAKFIDFPQLNKREDELVKQPKLATTSVRVKTQIKSFGHSTSMISESTLAHQRSQITTVMIFEDSRILNDSNKQFVAQEVKKIKKISLKKTKLLLKAGELSVEKRFHELIDNLPNILLILRLVNGVVLGAFTQTGFNKEENEKTKALIANKSVLLNVSDEKVYPSLQSDASIGYSPDGLMWGKREFFFNCITMTLSCTLVENGVFWPSLNEVKEFLGENEKKVDQFQIYRLYLS